MNILIADTEVLLRDAVSEMIKSSDPTSFVRTCGAFNEIFGILNQHPEIRTLLVDFNMTQQQRNNGLLCLLHKFPEHFIILTAGKASYDDISQCYRAGVHGFILKSIPGRALVSAIEIVQFGERYFPASMSNRPAETGPLFTERETRVLMELRVGGTNKRIALSLGIDESSVKGSLRTAGHKLGGRNRTEIALLATKLIIATVS